MCKHGDSLILMNGPYRRFYGNKGGRTYTDSVVFEQLSIDIGIYGITVAVSYHDVHDVLLVDSCGLLCHAFHFLQANLIAVINQLLHLP